MGSIKISVPGLRVGFVPVSLRGKVPKFITRLYGTTMGFSKFSKMVILKTPRGRNTGRTTDTNQTKTFEGS